MKINKTRHIKIASTAALFCLLLINCNACPIAKKAKAAAHDNKPDTGDSSQKQPQRTPAGVLYYDSNHELND